MLRDFLFKRHDWNQVIDQFQKCLELLRDYHVYILAMYKLILHILPLRTCMHLTQSRTLTAHIDHSFSIFEPLLMLISNAERIKPREVFIMSVF